MARVVIVGTPSRRRRITQGDVADTDLRSSHFELTVADGLDFRGRDLRDVSFIEGRFTNCDFGGAQASFIYSRNTTYTGCTIPTDVDSLNHDMVAEVVHQARLSLPVVDRVGADLIRDHTRASYINSWRDTMHKLSESGLSTERMRQVFGPVFQLYPKLFRRMDVTLRRGGFKPAVPLRPTPTPTVTQRARATNRNDRYEVARLWEDDHPGQAAYIWWWTPWERLQHGFVQGDPDGPWAQGDWWLPGGGL